MRHLHSWHLFVLLTLHSQLIMSLDIVLQVNNNRSHEMPETDQSPEAGMEMSFEYLLVDVARMYKTLFNRQFQPLVGLTQAQSRTLIHLSRNEGINQARLAEILEIQPITLARALDRLAADGWVERRQDPGDRRAFTLHLLPKAEPALAEMRDLVLALREETMKTLSTEERMAFVRTLKVVQDNIAAVDAKNERNRAEQEPVKNATIKETVR